MLSSCHQDGDYINASYVNIPLPGNNKTLHYIATQGTILQYMWLLDLFAKFVDWPMQDLFRTLLKISGHLFGSKESGR